MTDRHHGERPGVQGLHALQRLANRRILILNWRDPAHPLAGGAEIFAWEIATHLARSGAEVTLLAAKVRDLHKAETLGRVRILRRGGRWTVYVRAAVYLLRNRHLDAVIDCQNGIPFLSPLFTSSRTATVLLVHHVHQDQFRLHFSRLAAAMGRWLEGPICRWVYKSRPVVAVSPSTRAGVRQRLGLRGPIFVVPNGMADLPSVERVRAPSPLIVSVGRLVRHKRFDQLLLAAAQLRERVPGLQVELIGSGPELPALQAQVEDLGLGNVVTLSGRLDEVDKIRRLARAWLQVQPSVGEGWCLTALEGNALGVPCVAFDVPGLRDSIRPGKTGWLVPTGGSLTSTVETALSTLACPETASRWSDACQAWARCFDWQASSERMAGVILEEIARRARDASERRDPRRSDIVCSVTLSGCSHHHVRALRRTVRQSDTLTVTRDMVHLLLYGCDEHGAAVLLDRAGVTEKVRTVRLASGHDLLAPFSPDALRCEQ